MSHQSDLFAALTAAPAIAALVGGRVFADLADGSAAAPYLVYQVVSTRGSTSHDRQRPLEFPLYQISCWAAGKAAAIALAAAVNAALDGVTHSGASAVTTTFAGQSGTYESDTKLFGEILEFQAAATTN